jgi:hypothetical protein
MVSVTRKMNEHTNMCLVASKKRWRQLWHIALEISKGFELQVANFSNLSLSRVQETETEVETESEVEVAGRHRRRRSRRRRKHMHRIHLQMRLRGTRIGRG